MGSRSGRSKNIGCEWCQGCFKKLDQRDKDYAQLREKDNPGNKHLCINCWDKYAHLGWCKTCQEPVIYYENSAEGRDNNICPNCSNKVRRMARDLRPVFARERAILLYYQLINDNEYREANIWRGTKNPYYFVDGKKVKFPMITALNKDVDNIRTHIEGMQDFEKTDLQIIQRYKRTSEVNNKHITNLEDHAREFLIRLRNEEYPDLPMVVSFSGGKDSTVIADLVKRSLGLVQLDLIFNNTTLEHAQTLHYIKQYAEDNAMSFVETWGRNNYINRGNYLYQVTPKSKFSQIVKEIGPPSRGVRWCCSVFKANGINDIIQAWGEKVLTIYGIRNNESVMRSYYCPVTEQGKIGMQVTASPIINWSDFDVWIYILKYGILFNDLYRYGFGRVGCWLCPMNSSWSDILTKLYFPTKYYNWRDLLVSYAKKIGKQDAEEYVDSGNWKKRFGGSGRVNSYKGLRHKICGLRDNTMQYNLQRVVEIKPLLEYFKPFGSVDFYHSNPNLGYYYIDVKGCVKKLVNQLMVEIIDGSDTVRVTFIQPRNIELIKAYVKYQLTKYEVCIQCTACEIACPHGAINVVPGATSEDELYTINDAICWQQDDCIECTWHFESNGCLIAKSLYSTGG